MENILKITKALGDKNRLRVIMVLMKQKELCVCQITEMLKLATPTVSRHMSILQNADLVTNRKEGRWVYYRLSSFPEMLEQWLQKELSQSKDHIKDMETLSKIVPKNNLCKK